MPEWYRREFPDSKQIDDPKFIDGLKRVADADQVMDSANPDIDLMQTMVKINDKIPSLRIMLDHLPSFDPTPAQQASYDAVPSDSRLLRPKQLPMIEPCRSRTMKSGRLSSAGGRRPNGRKIRKHLAMPAASIGRQI